MKEPVVKGIDTQQVTPEYVLQPHAISRSSFRLSANARKLIAMGMALLPSDLSDLTVTFSITECCKSLGLDPSGNNYILLKEAVGECVEAKITLEKGRDGKDWEMFTWISHAKCEQNIITLEFSRGLATYLLELKKMYARIDLVDMGKLQSLYAIRYYELAKSYESLAGQRGNREKSWFFERTIGDLRKIMGVEAEKYTKTNDFKKRVIEGPLEELNAANLGIKITVEYIRRGTFIDRVRFLCQRVDRTMQSRKKKGASVLPAPEKLPLNDHSLEEKELEHIKKLYPEEYVEHYTAILANPTTNFLRDNPRLWKEQADRLACQELVKRHGIRK